ncbi:hypothetical protein [Leptospira stimsonii]|uniref:Uncharacterized protein n=1 Tax=Leptospira stimsonii TaxID=2202203 RepID=A0A8B3CQZ3_9LEPT|nr:hypothetical protein [Leptospira stimsonii]RHX86388.1 hypothetical protein DLM78_11195 [Leptospira stimsonii]
MVTKNISVLIRASWETVRKYLSEPRNVPECASGLCESIELGSDEEWIIDASQGKVKTIFGENEYGILNHRFLPNERTGSQSDANFCKRKRL